MSSEHDNERWNYRVLLSQGILNTAGYQFTSEKLVLPFLYTAAGLPAVFSGLLVPIAAIAKLGAQIIAAPVISAARNNKRFVGLAIMTTVLAVMLISATVNTMAANGLVAVFLLVATLMGAAGGVRSLAFKDMLGRILPIDRSNRLLFMQASIAGIIAIVVTLASLAILAPGTSAIAHQELIWLGIGLMTLSAIAMLAVREPAKPQAAESGARPEGRSSHIQELRNGFRAAFALAWFRRFVVARTLFLSIELAMPFYSIHAATYHGNNSSGLNTFVIASSLGLVLGGIIWPRFDPRAIRLVLAAAAIVTLAGGALALTIEMKPDLQTPFIYAPVFVLVAIGTQGISTGRTLFLADAATDTERPFCIAVSSAVIGLIAVAVGAVLGILANLQGVAWPILSMIGLNIGAALMAMTLRVPEKEFEATGRPTGLPARAGAAADPSAKGR